MANIMIKDLRPLSFVDGDGFREFVLAVEPGLKNYGRKAMSRLSSEKYKTMKEGVIAELASLKLDHGISLTTDTWTSSANDSLMSVTAHFIDNDWRFRQLLLSTESLDGRHTAENLVSRLEELQGEFRVMKVLSVTHDNAANISSAMTLSD